MARPRIRAITVALATAVATPTHAQDAAQNTDRPIAFQIDRQIAYRIDGTCPGEQALREALSAELARATAIASPSHRPAAPWILTVRSRPDGVELILVRPDGTRAVQRTLRSRDCAALAEACAVIVAAHVSSPVWPARPPAAPLGAPADPPTPAKPATPSPGDDRPPEALVPPPARSASPPKRSTGRSAPPDGAPAVEQATVSPPDAIDRGVGAPGLQPVRRSLPARRASFGWSIAGSGGVGVDPFAAAAFGQLDTGIHLQNGWAVQLSGALLATEAQPGTDSGLTTVERAQGALRLEAGTRVGDRWWLQPAAGLSAVVSRTRLRSQLDPPMAETVRVHPALTASVRAGRRFGAWSLRAELGGAFFPIADRYLAGDQEVARSPRTALQLGLGIEIDLPR